MIVLTHFISRAVATITLVMQYGRILVHFDRVHELGSRKRFSTNFLFLSMRTLVIHSDPTFKPLTRATIYKHMGSGMIRTRNCYRMHLEFYIYQIYFCSN